MPEIGNYSARVALAYQVERARTNIIQCPIYRNGALVTPTSGTITIYDPSNAVVVNGEAVTITSSIATYSVTTLAAYPYGDGWRVEWALTMPDSTIHTFRVGMANVYFAWSPVLADQDLFRRVSALNPALGAKGLTNLTTYQDYIDEASIEIQRRLTQAGKRPWLMVDATELREAHLLLTLTLIFEDFVTRNNPAYAEVAKNYRTQWEASWSRAKLTFDWAQDGTGVNALSKRGARQSGFWMGSRQ